MGHRDSLTYLWRAMRGRGIDRLMPADQVVCHGVQPWRMVGRVLRWWGWKVEGA